MYGKVSHCMVRHPIIWPRIRYTAISSDGKASQCMVRHPIVWQGISLYGRESDIRQLVVMARHPNVWGDTSMYGYVSKCMASYTNVYGRHFVLAYEKFGDRSPVLG